MNVLVACTEDRDYEFRVEVHELRYDRAKNRFSMPCVMGDDWFQKVNCLLPLTPIDVRFIESSAVVLFQSRNDVEQFSKWLVEAEKQVEHGFRTMRG